MEKKVIDIELFFTPVENGAKIEQNKYELSGQIHDDSYSLLENIDDWIDYSREYKHIKCDRSIRMGRTVINKHLYESNYIDGLRSEIEIKLKIRILDEAARKRLESNGYSDDKVKEYKGLDSFDCILCNDRIFYDDISFLWYVDEVAEKEYLEVRKKETFRFIRNESYRKWLLNNKDWYICHDEIIINAPIDISVKIRLLHEIENDEKRKMYRNSDCCKEALMQYEKAIELISNYSYAASYVLHEHERVIENGKRRVKKRITTHRSFDKVRKAIAEKYHGEEPDEFANRWNTVERFDLVDGNYNPVAFFVVSEKGNIWHVMCRDVEYEHDRRRWHAMVRFSNLELPAPFKDGDIVTIDRRPFNEPYHILIVKGEGEEYTPSPYCLVKTEEGIKFEWCEFLEKDELIGLSPFLTMELFEGELPEKERILGELSRKVKEDDDFWRKIFEAVNFGKPADAEERLWKALAEKEEAEVK